MKQDLTRVSKVEHVAANALPSYHTETYDGWRLRYNHGVTRRANSVLAEQVGELVLQDKLERVEAWYKALGVKARFQLCPASKPENIAHTLLSRGYTVHSGAHVQLAKLDDVLSKQARAGIQVSIAEQCSEAWLALYKEAEQASEDHIDLRRKMFERIQAKTAFVTAFVEEQKAAVGLGVFETGYVGIFNMATLASMRQKGAASAALLAIARWGKTLAAQQMYLQVASENQVAQTVYKKFGFETLYAYEYFEQG